MSALIDKILPSLITALALVAYTLLLAHPINLVTADLGRHIKNGELILESDFSILKQNVYSYTYPDFSTTNHHWLSGAIFYLVWKSFGLTGSHIFFILLSLTSFYIFFDLSKKQGGVGLAGLLAILTIPLLLERNEVRPEVFSYIFSGIFLWLLTKYRSGEIGWRWLLVLPASELLWVNSHIYFFLGPVTLGAFLTESLILKNWRLAKEIGFIFFLVLSATLINPYGLAGALAPFFIFKNYGYNLAENQTVWFIEKILPDPNYFIFKITFFILTSGLAARIWLWLSAKNKGLTLPSRSDLGKNLITDTIFTLGFSMAGWLAIRNFAIFGLFALPITADNLANLFLKGPPFQEGRSFLNRIALTTLALVVLIILSGELRSVYPRQQDLKLGLENGDTKALEFFKANGLAGPIFNNYDIGSYLIYGLYPQEKVFVDNRPEAYPADFFSKTYIPMQENKKIWDEKSALYKFNAIIFSYRDYTPWGQTFFRRILTDPDWAVVFADSRVVILLKNNEQNKNIIAKYSQTIRIGHQTN